MANSPSPLIIEVCVDSVQSALNAVRGGANRLELCGNLGIGGGTTPSFGLLKAVQQAVDVPIMAMVRPRTGDFLYSAAELEVMVQDIRMFKQAGVAGVVFGVLRADGRVDVQATKRLVDEARPLQGTSDAYIYRHGSPAVCFHRAFDMTRDPGEALRDVASVPGITRILTSGHAATALDGLNTLRGLVRSAGVLSILPGSGINGRTVQDVLDALDIAEVHMSGGGWMEGGMAYRRNGMGMGADEANAWNIWTTSEDSVRAVRELCDMKRKPAPQPIWYSNAIFFVSVHLAAVYGALFWRPYYAVPKATLLLAFFVWQLADFGITVRASAMNCSKPVERPQIGYHRLYSHRAFRATLPVRLVLAALGSAGFQGSIKWWCLRHRLHHRFTDDPVHDPYAATRGLFYSHMGWIFYKPTYERMDLVDREDLDSDPVVRFQHNHYVLLAVFFGFVIPTILGALWGDVSGAYVWGGLVSRLFIWHSTFLVNSLAHWDGLQPYSDEDTSRGNLILALLTGGEGSHNFHSFPHDWRSGPHLTNWDPSKWIIALLHRFGLVYGLRSVRDEDLKEALDYMRHKEKHGVPPEEDTLWTGETWNLDKAHEYILAKPGSCVVVIDDYFVDVTAYLGEHPGGAMILRKYSVRPKQELVVASWAFDGGLNNHSRSARRRMKEYRVAKYSRE
ncbi:Stearoyl-CoA desaturase [Mycena kentingensis (nom. inval.)]|nr:Stearoyl-CoA desaturase [Mycena kentingensis (nom. inval.)]